MKNYYEELEVSKNASDEVINRAYKVLAKKYHPDTTTVDKQLAEERFKKISEAYETLSNKQKRAEYDKTLVPDIDVNKYNKMLQDNKRLSQELLRLKAELDNINTTKVNYKNNRTNTNQSYNNYSNSYRNINYTQPNNNRNVNYTQPNYSHGQQYRKITFLDELKYKLNEFLKKCISIMLTIGIMLIALSILYIIPSTRNFLINDLHLGILFGIFK